MKCYAYQIGTSVCRVQIEQSLQTVTRRVEKITCSAEWDIREGGYSEMTLECVEKREWPQAYNGSGEVEAQEQITIDFCHIISF